MVRSAILQFFLLMMVPLFGFGQRGLDEDNFGVQNWGTGTVLLADGGRLAGRINYNYLIGAIQYKTDSTELAIPTSQVVEFSFFDSLKNVNRNFSSFGLPDRPKAIYEIITENKELAFVSTIKGKLGAVEDNSTITGVPSFPGLESYHRYDQMFETFLAIESNGQITEIGTFAVTASTLSKKRHRNMHNKARKFEVSQNDLIKALEKFNPKVKNYIKSRRIGIRKRENLVEILMWINSQY